MEDLAHKICPACQQRAMGQPKFCPNCAADLTAVELATGDPYEGTLIGERYRLDELIGVGGMGRVYRGAIATLDRVVAIKILHPHLTHDRESHARFSAEAHAMAGLSHPNVVGVIDYGRTHAGLTYLVMDYIDGQALEDVLVSDFPLARNRMIDLTLQILAALDEAHGQGIIHRDLKPENILIQTMRGRGELVKVLDFGIAKLMEETPERAGLTKSGVVCGTPEYMSPEQARGKQLDPRSDLYAVGVILYRMLAGRLPFSGDSAVEILHRHLKEKPVPPNDVAAREPDALDAICLRALEKKRKNRFTTADEFRDAIVAAGQLHEEVDELRCHNCGTDIRARDNFCSHCGTPARAGPTSRAAEPRLVAARESGRAPTGGTAQWVVQRFPLPFSARLPELAMMKQALGGARPGVTVTTLSGVPGVGKTRFLREVVSLAGDQGWRALRVDADPSGFAPPMAPIRRAVKDVLGLGARVDAVDLNRVANLAGLSHTVLPGLAELFGLDGPLRLAEFEVRTREAQVSAAQALASFGRGANALLAFDDVDAWDGASKKVVSLVRAQTVPAPLLVVLCGQRVEEEFESLAGMELDKMGLESVGEMLKVAVGRDDIPKLAKGFRVLAPVTPLRVELVLRMIASGIKELPSPDAPIDSIVEALVEGMDDRPRRALEAASVLGSEFPDAQIRSLLVREAGDAHEAIDRALAHLVKEGWLLPSRPGHREFGSPRIQAAVYRSVGAERARILHALAAEIVTGEDSSVLTAMHRMRAGQARAVDALRDAAAYCIDSFDDARGADLLEAALRAFQRTEITDFARDTQLSVELARAHLFAHAPREAVEALEALAERAGRPDTYEYAWILGKALGALGRREEAAEAFNRCAGAALRMGDPTKLLDAHARRANAMKEHGDHEAALNELQQGLDMATFGLGPRAEVDFPMWRFLLAVADTYKATKDILRARQHCQHALWQAERLGDTLGQLRSQHALADALTAEQQATRGEQHRNRAIALARDLGDRRTTADLLIARSRYRLALGRTDEARANAESAMALAREVDWEDGMIRARAMIAEIQAPQTA